MLKRYSGSTSLLNRNLHVYWYLTYIYDIMKPQIYHIIYHNIYHSSVIYHNQKSSRWKAERNYWQSLPTVSVGIKEGQDLSVQSENIIWTEAFSLSFLVNDLLQLPSKINIFFVHDRSVNSNCNRYIGNHCSHEDFSGRKAQLRIDSDRFFSWYATRVSTQL